MTASALAALLVPAWVVAQEAIVPGGGGGTWPILWETLTVQHYNTRLVMTSTVLLGMAGGLVGTFLLLRRQSLMGDTLSHATFPGVALAFLVMVGVFGESGRALPWLLLGAAVTGLLGLAVMSLIDRTTTLKQDASMAIVLSVFYGIGVALYGLVQQMPGGSAAGLRSLIYGKTSALIYQDFLLIALVAGASIVIALVFFKELKLLCFDRAYGKALGWPMHAIDALLLALVTAVTVTGLQAVGLILVIAILIIPAAAARFWTERLGVMLCWAGAIGAVGAWIGTAVSATFPRMPAGAIIVLALSALFILSMALGTRRGVVHRWREQWNNARKADRHHVLRSMYETLEKQGATDGEAVVELAALQARRSWAPRRLRRCVDRAEREGMMVWRGPQQVRLTRRGFDQAAQIARNHRLWELYMIEYADAAPAIVDHYADRVEHVLAEPMIRQLERLLEPTALASLPRVPSSPHQLETSDPPPAAGGGA